MNINIKKINHLTVKNNVSSFQNFQTIKSRYSNVACILFEHPTQSFFCQRSYNSFINIDSNKLFTKVTTKTSADKVMTIILS